MDIRQNPRTTRRATGGFTMMEMMVAVAILVILMGVAFVGVIEHQRTMKQVELDGTAKELFIAAQNHLSMAQNQGVLKDVNANRDALVGKSSAGESSPMRYWYVDFGGKVGGVDKLASPNDSTLYEMLPAISIDDTVRLGGSYVIAYDLQAARVTSVFYSDQSNLSGHHFSSGDYGTLFPGLEGDDHKSDRLRAFSEGCVIGWYGGEGLPKDAATLYAPNLKLINAERLMVEVSFTRENFNKIKDIDGASVRVIMRGDTSKRSKIVYDNGEGESAEGIDQTNKAVLIVLDDITSKDMHFAERWCTDSSKSNAPTAGELGPLIPGENISVYAEVYSNKALTKTARSVTKHSNSLFANILQKDNAEAGSVATISNIRHLENLDAKVSGYDLDKLGPDGATTVRQVADIRWRSAGSKKPVGFTDAIVKPLDGMDVALDTNSTVQTYSDAESVLIYLLNGTDGVKTSDDKGTFVPVVPRAKDSTGFDQPIALTYDGNNKKISNVKIDVAGSTDRPDAGIFSTLEAGSSVKNLELIDCSVKTSNGNAGTLLGSASGKLPKGGDRYDITVENVLAHDSSGTVQSKVEGTAAVGGLVGKLTGEAGDVTVTIDGCGAAVLVSTTGAGTDKAAGGLIGLTSGPVSVKNSYAGGHTKTNTGMYDTVNFNVVATSGAAGGLIGAVGGSGATIQNCYATTSVSRGGGSTDNIGGLVGQASGATITNCYATGLIGAGPTSEDATLDATRGAFAGNLDSGTVTNLSNDKYYEIINDAEMLKGTMRAVGNVEGSIEEEKLSALDTSLITYNRFYKAKTRADSDRPNEVDNAKAYDPELVNRYKRSRSAELTAEQDSKEKELAGRYDSTYPLETVYMLNCNVNYADEKDVDGTATKPTEEWENSHPWAKSHYGDWPSPETLVVNTKQ